MKKLFFLFIFTVILTHTHSVYASTVYTFSDTNVTTNQNLDISISCDGGEIGRFYFFNPSGATISDSSCNGGVPYQFNNWTIDNITSWMSEVSPLGNYKVYYIDEPTEYPTCITFDGSTNDLSQCLIDFPAMSLVATLTVSENGGVSSNTTWGSNNGFWGETTPLQIIGGMEASVQETGMNLWPLLVFVGIGLAFSIGGMLVINIKQNAGVGSKETINPKGEEFIEHSAEDLEFKREYGKRKTRT